MEKKKSVSSNTNNTNMYAVYLVLAKLFDMKRLEHTEVQKNGFRQVDIDSLRRNCFDRPESKLLFALVEYITCSWCVYNKDTSNVKHYKKIRDTETKKVVSRQFIPNLKVGDLRKFKIAHHALIMQLASSNAKSKKGAVLEVYDSVKHFQFPTFDPTNGFHIPKERVKETKRKPDRLTDTVFSDDEDDKKNPNFVVYLSHSERLVTVKSIEDLKSSFVYLVSKATLAEKHINGHTSRPICCSALNKNNVKKVGSLKFDTFCDNKMLSTTTIELNFHAIGGNENEYNLPSTASTVTRHLSSSEDKIWFATLCGSKITELLINSKTCVFCHDAKCTFAAIPYRYTEVKGELSARCPNGHIFCVSCNKKAHGGPCVLDEHDEMWLAENKDNMMCPSCSARIQKDGGCNHMHHKICDTHFCATCFQIFPGNVQWADHTGCNQFPRQEQIDHDIDDMEQIN